MRYKMEFFGDHSRHYSEISRSYCSGSSQGPIFSDRNQYFHKDHTRFPDNAHFPPGIYPAEVRAMSRIESVNASSESVNLFGKVGQLLWNGRSTSGLVRQRLLRVGQLRTQQPRSIAGQDVVRTSSGGSCSCRSGRRMIKIIGRQRSFDEPNFHLGQISPITTSSQVPNPSSRWRE